MKDIFEKLSSSEDRLASRIRSFDARERALKIYKLLAQARVAVSRVALTANSTKMPKPGTKTYKARLKRQERLKVRLQKALRHVAVFDGAARVVLVRRAIAQSRIIGGRG